MIGDIKDYGKLTFCKTGECDGDCTCSYDITFRNGENNTVKEFVDEVLKSRDFDFGNIHIAVGDRKYHDVVEYEKGKIIKRAEEFNHFSNAHIIGICAGGGWGSLDYTVRVEENNKIPQGEYCNGCGFLIFERQPWLDIEGDCCQHGELTCLRHKTKIEVDKTISNGTPFFQIPLYKKCKGCLEDTSSTKAD